MNVRKSNALLKTLSSSLVDMPAPANISFMWNFGSLLGICLMTQIITGLLVATHYTSSMEYAFYSIIHLCRDVENGWMLRAMHSNGASMFFILLYLHMFRGIYYSSYMLSHVWYVGVTILLLSMATAFLGYVLPCGQMSFWGTTVITNLLSTVPYMGTLMVQCLWGGFAVSAATLTRFFSFHFILPFLILSLVIIHILFLHMTGSTNPLGVPTSSLKVAFHPFFIFKDLMGMVTLIIIYTVLVLFFPYLLGDVENFNLANPLSTPTHIQPEWYYLFAYAILRSIPNKLGGVIALLVSVAIYYLLPVLYFKWSSSTQFYIFAKFNFYTFISVIFLLTWIGSRPVEAPFILYGQILTVLYFSYFLLDTYFLSGHFISDFKSFILLLQACAASLLYITLNLKMMSKKRLGGWKVNKTSD